MMLLLVDEFGGCELRAKLRSGPFSSSNNGQEHTEVIKAKRKKHFMSLNSVIMTVDAGRCPLLAADLSIEFVRRGFTLVLRG